MGTDYTLVNISKKEWIWLGRNNLGTHRVLTKKILDFELSRTILNEADEVLTYNVCLERHMISYYFGYYNFLKKYIKGNRCYCQDEYACIPEEYENNLEIENDLFHKDFYHFERCRLLR